MAANQPIEKFQKGAYYEDVNGDLFYCTNGRQRKTDDGHSVVSMKATKNGKPTGKANEEFTDTFVRKLTKAEVNEHVEVERREAEAVADAEASTTVAMKSAGKSKAKQAKQKMSALDAAAKVLSESNEPLRSKQMIEQMAAKGYWTSPGGQTPWATLYSAILREINTKGDEARFEKLDRGLFTMKS